MPLKRPPLDSSQVQQLREWIAAGAPAPANEQPSSDRHWAFVPPREPAIPSLPDTSHPIDAFIRQRHRAENLKASRAGKLMMWGLGLSAATPDGAGIFALGYGKAIGNGLNHPRFRNAEFDTIYQKLQLLPDGPERFELMQRAAKIMVTYMPVKFSGHRYITDMSQPWVIGYRRNPLVRDFWKYVDIDTSLLPR